MAQFLRKQLIRRLSVSGLHYVALALPIIIYFTLTYSRFTFPKIFADEFAGLDAGLFIQDSSYERFTGYRAGLGLVLQPLLWIFSSRDDLYRAQQLINCGVLVTAAIICFRSLLGLVNRSQAFWTTFSSFMFFPALYSTMRISTETWLILAASIAFYLFTSLYIKKDSYAILLSIIVLQFISIIHTRLMAVSFLTLALFFYVKRKKGENVFALLSFTLITALIFGIINRYYSVQNYEASFASSLLKFEVLDGFIKNYLLFLFGKLFIINLESFGLLLVAVLCVIGWKEKFFDKNRSVESIAFKIMTLVLLLFLSSLMVTTLFELFLSLNPVWREPLASLVFATRYVDGLMPLVFAITITFVIVNLPTLGKIINRRSLAIGLLFTLVLGSITIKIGVFVADPMRSPFAFGVSKGRQMEPSFLFIPIFILIIYLAFFLYKPKVLYIMPLSAWLFCATAFGWEAGIESGWQKNHVISDTANHFLSETKSIEKCIILELENPNNWWSLYNYRFWSEYPVYSTSDKDCPLLITDKLEDDINDVRVLVAEEQATGMFLLQNP